MPRKTQKNKKTQKRGGTKGSTKSSRPASKSAHKRPSSLKIKTEYKNVTVDFKNEDGSKHTYNISVAKNTGLLDPVHPDTKGIFEHIPDEPASIAEKEFIHKNIVEVPDDYDVWRKSYLHYSIYKLQ
jgi:hypothetical protein